MEPYPRTWVEVDLGSLRANLEVIRGRVGEGVSIALVCKADAYGHGLVPTGRFAARNGADWLAVATVQEGVALREAGVEARIVVMSPILAVEADQAVFYDLDVFFESLAMASVFSEVGLRLGRVAKLHLKVDTGLHRFGCSPNSVVELLEAVRRLEGVEVVGIGHHFVDSAFDAARTSEQVAVFESVLAGIDPPVEFVHQANSAGTTLGVSGNLVRVGIFAYGVDPAGLMHGALTPVMRWFARVTSLRSVLAGETVSYSSTHRLKRDSRIATLGVGYGDGYARSLSNKGEVWLGGRRCPVVGLVCMDQILVDVTDCDGVEFGDTAELIGENLLVSELSSKAGTNSHELLCRVMSRVSRRYIYPD